MSGTDPRDAEDLAWLEARELGVSVPPPIAARRAAAYGELQAQIAALPDEVAPVGWEDEVMAALPLAGAPSDPSPPPSVGASAGAPGSREDRWVDATRGARRRWVPIAAAVAAAAGLLLWWQRAPGPSLDPFADEEPSTRILRSPGSRSGDGSTQAALRDVLQVEVTESHPGELRIYRDDREVVVRCPGQAGCTQDARRLTAELRLTAPGRYRAVYLQPAPSNPPTGTLDGDLAVCHCSSRTAVPIVVQ